MSYEEKGAWVYLGVVLSSFAAYLAVVVPRLDGTSVADVSYSSALVRTIIISIVASVVVRTLVETVRPSERHRGDARDKDINRFGEYVGGIVLAVAMLAPFILALEEADHFWIANAMYAAYVLSSLVGTSLKLVAYRRGI